MEKKHQKIALWSLLILVLGVLGYFFFGDDLLAVGDCQDVYCNDYEFICCGIEENTINYELKNLVTFTCGGSNFECTVVSSNGVFAIGSENCHETGFLGLKWITCSDDVKYGQVDLPVTFYPGDVLHTIDNNQFEVQLVLKDEVLRWTGSSADYLSGRPVQGADACTFVINKRVYDTYGSLIEDPESNDVSKTVRRTDCLLASTGRHVCGNTCETCNSDADCISGHPLVVDGVGAECQTGQLQFYGCRNYGSTPSPDLLDILPWEQVDQIDVGSRCEVVRSQEVQCCPNTDSCGEGFCDPETFTCQPTRECTEDWECGQAQYCDRDEMKLKEPNCNLLGKCENSNVQDVECCYDQDCAGDWYCDDNYECKESTTPKTDCPYDCCVDEQGFYDKPCVEIARCENNQCIGDSTPTECLSGCAAMSDWNPMKQLCNFRCELEEQTKELLGNLLWVVVGGTALGVGALAYPKLKKKGGRKK